MDIRGILWNTPSIYEIQIYSLLIIQIHSQLPWDVFQWKKNVIIQCHCYYSSSEELPLFTSGLYSEADSDKSECDSRKFILLSVARLALNVVVDVVVQSGSSSGS